MNQFQSYSRCLTWVIALLLSALAAGCGGGGGDGGRDPILGVPALVPGLLSVAVTPATASIPVTGTQQFTAIATFSDGSSRDVTANPATAWTSGTLTVATLSPNGAGGGRATGVAPGTSLITATFGGLSGSATLTVTAATSVSFVVTPDPAAIPVNGTQQYTATETFSDGTTFNRTAASSWTSGTLAVATMSPNGAGGGLATGVAPGISVITATLGGLSDSATLTVTAATSVSFVVAPDPASIPVSGTQQYTATETFSDGTTFNRTATSSWTSGTLAVATMSPNGAGGGLATGVAPGISVITATLGGLSDSATLTVTAATSVSFVVTPDLASVTVDGTQQYTATETFSDGTTFNRTVASSWTTANVPPGGASVATMSPNGVGGGLATGRVVGQSDITATLGVLLDSARLTVTAAPIAASCLVPGTPLPLASAASFGVVGGTALTITNPTSVTGDVGSPTITPASGPSTLVGTMFDSSPATELTVISTAVADMQTGINCAVARGCDFLNTTGPDFGGQVLAPGVHCVTPAMSVGSNLTLSTPGVYIFRSDGALTTATTVTVALGGLANAGNTSVFWIPVGATSIGATTTFLGTIMSTAGAITLGANTTLLGGRTLSGAAVTLDTNQITIP